MNVRLIMATISTLLEETAIIIVVLFGLPMVGISLPLPGLVALMVAWLAISVIIYRIGSQALRRKQLAGLPNMVGCKGMVVSPLAPEGLVRIKGELWVARSAGGELELGEVVIVVVQDSLKLVVRESRAADDVERARYSGFR